MGVENLDKIFKPKSIAVIGASDKIGSAGYRIFRNLIGSGYEGIVYPVNPKKESIQGVQAYPSVNELPKVVDLAIVATPSNVVLDVVEQCGKRGIIGVLIISAGFKEIGKEGVALEEIGIEEVKDEKGEYSWGDSVRKIYYKLGPKASPKMDPKVQDFFEKKFQK